MATFFVALILEWAAILSLRDGWNWSVDIVMGGLITRVPMMLSFSSSGIGSSPISPGLCCEEYGGVIVDMQTVFEWSDGLLNTEAGIEIECC